MSLEDDVREAWKNACEGGYEEELRTMNCFDIAGDMIDCDAAIAEHIEGDDLFALQWRIAAMLPAIMGQRSS